MARIRTIKPEFWTDEKIGSISPTARLLYIGIWTHCDDYGICRASGPFLKAQVFPYDSVSAHGVLTLMDEIWHAGLIDVAEVQGETFLRVKHFERHQVINRKSKRPSIPGNYHTHKSTYEEISRSTHGVFTEGSVPERYKGKVQGKGKGSNTSAPLENLSEGSVSVSEEMPTRIKKGFPDTDKSHGEVEVNLPGFSDADLEPLESRSVPTRTNTRKQTSKAIAARQTVKPTSEVWDTYRRAFKAKYGHDPVRNAKTNGQLANFVKRLGVDEGCQVIEFYLQHNDAWYLKSAHSTDNLLKDAEKLRTEMLSGVKLTGDRVKKIETSSENADAFNAYVRKAHGPPSMEG